MHNTIKVIDGRQFYLFESGYTHAKVLARAKVVRGLSPARVRIGKTGRTWGLWLAIKR